MKMRPNKIKNSVGIHISDNTDPIVLLKGDISRCIFGDSSNITGISQSNR